MHFGNYLLLRDIVITKDTGDFFNEISLNHYIKPV